MPGSQGKAIQLLQSFYVPLQAFLSIISGRYAADLSALNEFVNNEQILCEACCCELNRAGDGHDTKTCSIHQRAAQVLSDKTDPEKRALLIEQQRLAAKMNETAQRLASIDGKKG